MSLIRSVARLMLGDYDLYRIYTLDLSRVALPLASDLVLTQLVDASQLTESECVALRDLGAYAAPDARCFGAWSDGELVGACWFWYGRTYLKRGFWPLRDGEAKLVQITVHDRVRGRGIATQLLHFAAKEMQQAGFQRLYARIWHSHAPSIAAFEKAGWRYFAFVAVFHPFGRKRPVRFEWRKRNTSGSLGRAV